MTDSRGGRALVGAAVVLALVAGGALGFALRGGEVSRLDAHVDSLEEDLARVQQQLDDAVADDEEAPSGEAVTPAVPGEGAGERQIGYVRSVDMAGTVTVLTIDYVQFLTGDAATDAAAAHGDESPPPNDYYIVNDNPKLRDLPVAPGLTVTVVTNSDGTSDPDGHALTLAQWAASLTGPEAVSFKACPYWVTITDGTVTAIEAQYLP